MWALLCLALSAPSACGSDGSPSAEPSPRATPAPEPTLSPAPGNAAFFETDLVVTLRSEDTGATWQEVLPFPASLSFLNSREGWAASTDTLLETADGGRTWAALDLPVMGAVLGPIDFADRNTGILAAATAGDPRAGTHTVSLFNTSDGGESWSLAFEGQACERDSLLCLTAGGHALAVACGQTLRSSNSGATWVPVMGLPVSMPRPSCSGAADFWIVDPRGAWRSVDGGLSWTEQPVPARTTDVSFVSDRNGWAVAPDGFSTAIFRTNDGGETWERQLTTPAFDLEPPPAPSVHFEDARHGVVVEFRLSIFIAIAGWQGEPRRWLTDDGGASWHRVDLARESTSPRSHAFLGAIGLP